MDQFIKFLKERLLVDFEGELTLEAARNLLTGDREAKRLLAKLIADGGVDEMLLAVADCLADDVRDRLSDRLFLDRLNAYSESSS